MDKEPTQKDMIRETFRVVTQLSTVLLGVPGTDDTGLVGEVKQTKLNMNGLYKQHRKLSLRVWILIAILGGSGIISVGELTNLINLIGG